MALQCVFKHCGFHCKVAIESNFAGDLFESSRQQLNLEAAIAQFKQWLAPLTGVCVLRVVRQRAAGAQVELNAAGSQQQLRPKAHHSHVAMVRPLAVCYIQRLAAESNRLALLLLQGWRICCAEV